MHTVRMDCPISNATQIQIVFALPPSSSPSRSVSVQVRCTTTSFSYLYTPHKYMICYIKVLCTHTHRCCCCYCNFLPLSIRHLIYLEFLKLVYYSWFILLDDLPVFMCACSMFTYFSLPRSLSNVSCVCLCTHIYLGFISIWSKVIFSSWKM